MVGIRSVAQRPPQPTAGGLWCTGEWGRSLNAPEPRGGISDYLDETKFAAEISSSFGVSVAVSHICSGTGTDNFLVDAATGHRWFAKVYRDRTILSEELAAIDLASFARSGVPPSPTSIRPRRVIASATLAALRCPRGSTSREQVEQKAD